MGEPFIQLDRFTITGRGTVVTGQCPAAWAGLDASALTGRLVEIGGETHRIAVVERRAVPWPLREGEPIGLLLAEGGADA